LSYGGFESSISAGEESCRPTEVIPRSIVAAVLFGTAFYAFCVSGQVLGFGAGSAGVTRFARSTAPLGDLALAYVGPAMAAVLDVAAVLSALGAALVGVAVASRTGSRPDPGDCLAPDRDPGRRGDGEYDADVRAAAGVRTGRHRCTAAVRAQR
jgi:hypothetical protein